MTWTKLPDEYSDELADRGVSDAAYRTHTEAIGYIFRLEAMDLRIRKPLVRRFAGSADRDSAIKELVDLGLWRDRSDAYEIVHSATIIRQSITAQQAKRARDLRAKRAERGRKSTVPVVADVSDHVSADVSAAVIGDTDRQTVKRPFHGGGEVT